MGPGVCASSLKEMALCSWCLWRDAHLGPAPACRAWNQSRPATLTSWSTLVVMWHLLPHHNNPQNSASQRQGVSKGVWHSDPETVNCSSKGPRPRQEAPGPVPCTAPGGHVLHQTPSCPVPQNTSPCV